MKPAPMIGVGIAALESEIIMTGKKLEYSQKDEIVARLIEAKRKMNEAHLFLGQAKELCRDYHLPAYPQEQIVEYRRSIDEQVLQIDGLCLLIDRMD